MAKTLFQAAHHKYLDEDDDEGENCGIILFVPRGNFRRRLPSSLILDHCEIRSIGNEENLDNKYAHVRELDLAHNQLTEWNEIYRMLRFLPSLSFLNISHNNLQGEFGLDDGQTFPELKQLILNYVGIEWVNLQGFLQQAPNLEELHVSFNGIKTPEVQEEPEVSFPKIKKLHYDGNIVDHVDHLLWISKTFPNLEILKMTKCSLWTLRWGNDAPRSIQEKARSRLSPESFSYDSSAKDFPECSGDGKTRSCCDPADSSGNKRMPIFPNLRSLNLDHCLIDCWQEIEQLREWASLVDLRLQTCPLFHKLTEHERRQLTIARLPNIRVLNGGGLIGTEEREKAERSFLRLFHSSAVKPPRYNELLAVHGEVVPLVNVSFKPQRTVSVWFTYGDRRWREDVCIYQTVKEFKSKVCSMLGVSYSQLRVWYVDVAAELMRFPQKQLYSYNIEEGDEFIIDVKTN
nr:EOG090X05JJ [Eulimnadia texana]